MKQGKDVRSNKKSLRENTGLYVNTAVTVLHRLGHDCPLKKSNKKRLTTTKSCKQFGI